MPILLQALRPGPDLGRNLAQHSLTGEQELRAWPYATLALSDCGLSTHYQKY